MKITRLLHEVLEVKDSAITFEILLQDFGKWSRFTGKTGTMIKTTCNNNALPKFIDDDTALILSNALQKLKDRYLDCFKIWEQYYILLNDELDIVRIHYNKGLDIKTIRRFEKSCKCCDKKNNTYSSNKTKINKTLMLDIDSVKDVLRFSNSIIYNELIILLNKN